VVAEERKEDEKTLWGVIKKHPKC
jgi:hypothetical protein